MNWHILLLYFILLAFYSHVHCQTNYVEGSIVTSSNDTLKGFIDYRNWQKNPQKISFKENQSTNPTSFTPDDIKAFKAQGDIYISVFVKMETSVPVISALPENSVLEFEEDQVFLRKIYGGIKPLYIHVSRAGRSNFYIENNNTLELLVYRKYKRKSVISENKTYQKQLRTYFQGADCKKVINLTNNTSYNLKSLRRLFDAYAICIDPTTTREKIDPVIYNFGLTTGVSLSSLRTSSSTFNYFNNISFDSPPSLTGGLSLEIVLPRNQGRWRIINDLLFSSYDANGETQIQRTSDDRREYKVEIGQKNLMLMNQVKYIISKSKVDVYLTAGVSNGYIFDETNYVKEKSVVFGIERTNERDAIPFTQKHIIGLIGGIGVTKNNLSFDIRYENNDGLSKINDAKTRVGTIFCLFMYHF